MDRVRATITYFNPKGFGFAVLPDRGCIFVHAADVRQHKLPRVGDTIECGLVENPRNPQGRRRAVDVELVRASEGVRS
jgi:cold shock CspA family protein